MFNHSPLFRNSPNIRKRKSYKYKGLGFIVINVTTLIPLYEATHYLSIPDFMNEAETSRNYLKLKCLLRIYRVFDYISEKINQPGLNITMILTLRYLFRLFLLGHLAAAVMFLVTQIGEYNWTINLDKHKFTRNNSLHWYTFTFTFMAGTLLHNFPCKH